MISWREGNRSRLAPLSCLLVLMLLTGRSGWAEESESDEVRTATIQVTFTDLEPDRGGDLVASLFRGEEGWLEPEGVMASVKGPVDGQSMELTFEDVPFDESYAIQVFHDANRNGKLDFRRIIPIPKEGVGVSNNHTRMGPPKYDKAEFAVDREELRLSIILRYY